MEQKIVEKTEKITSYGYVVKNTGIVVLDASIKMAFKLFEEKQNKMAKEEALRESEEKFRLLFENMTTAFALHEMIYDDAGNPVDYRFLEINPAFEKMTEMRESDLKGRTVKDVLPGIEQYWMETYGRVAKTGEPIAKIKKRFKIRRIISIFPIL